MMMVMVIRIMMARKILKSMVIMRLTLLLLTVFSFCIEDYVANYCSRYLIILFPKSTAKVCLEKTFALLTSLHLLQHSAYTTAPPAQHRTKYTTAPTRHQVHQSTYTANLF